jgi:Tfp pilus assembly protein PilF
MAAAEATNQIRIEGHQGTLEILPKGASRWVRTSPPQPLEPGDRLRTGPNSRVFIHWSDQSVLSFGALTELEILPPHEAQALSGLHLIKGLLSFFHRDKPGRIRVITHGTVAGVEGTEFVMEVESVDNIERTTISLIDGKVQVSNDHGMLLLTNGQQAVSEMDKPPTLQTAGFIANNVLQWCLYYPAVLDPRECHLTAEEHGALSESLASYQRGDLLTALAKYPAGRQPGSDAESVYYAALLLSVGQVEQAEKLLRELEAVEGLNAKLARALQTLMAAVKRDFQVETTDRKLETTTELLAASYYEQSRARGDASLRKALDLARQAATNSTAFGFASARVAELEFSFGHTRSALDALNRSLALSPRNAQALTLKGFLIAAQNKSREAIQWFNHSIDVDAALGNAWLGRGLCRIRGGDRDGGREDLLIAAALEPQRSLLRSYLGKAYGDDGDVQRATHELNLAKELDRDDPTAWLYSALIKQQNNRINESVRDLEKSLELNENRRLYRSGFLLDEDRAVRRANLALLYQDAGMFDWSVREASRAVSSDYANYSAHLFLANSYNTLRDPNLVNLRYETATFSEYIMANLLSTVGGTPLSQHVSQQEYSRLFERDRPGISSTTTFLSNGDRQQEASQFGVFGNTSYALDAAYRSLNGQYRNNDLEQLTFSAQVKQQLTQKDSVYVQAVYNDLSAGDVRQQYDPSLSSPTLRFTERQEPNLLLGYHREWAPGLHTVFLGGRLNDTFKLKEPNTAVTTFVSGTNAVPTTTFDAVCGGPCAPFDLSFRSDFDAYSVELQQIWQQPRHTLIAGARYQTGETDTRSVLRYTPGAYPPVYNDPASTQENSTDLERVSFYGYYHWRIVDPLLLIAGVTYDRLDYPQNIDLPPVTGAQQSKDRVSPKAGFVWALTESTSARGAYTRSLGGLFFDTSVRLEPTQIAGFNQAFRSLINESLEGTIAGSEFETFGLGLDQKFPTSTYLTVDAELLRSTSKRSVGAFNYIETFGTSLPFIPAFPVQTRQELDFEEQSLIVSFNQLLGDGWSCGARYRLSQAELESNFLDVPDAVLADKWNRALLHQLNLFAIYNHPAGFFAQVQSLWNKQSNHGYSSPLADDDFWQFNAFIGYRFPRRYAELTFGILNLTDQDYRLNPLNLYGELPRERTAMVSLRLNF